MNLWETYTSHTSHSSRGSGRNACVFWCASCGPWGEQHLTSKVNDAVCLLASSQRQCIQEDVNARDFLYALHRSPAGNRHDSISEQTFNERDASHLHIYFSLPTIKHDACRNAGKKNRSNTKQPGRVQRQTVSLVKNCLGETPHRRHCHNVQRNQTAVSSPYVRHLMMLH